ncbi:hypothetical protein JZO70_06175 [Enterococcus sp. 669A]|uniref:DUF5057 domain-containing protein n=1 Tax=Candidatus Enterococcus moelleringii TaxID=2815325 RepID=A0ABS3L7Z5_9ENTE|nr:hypothetical protein [Enterococcus sp. 669A]MBO1305735.1 hypothetical protein [Enterococcus sp. 669A]
MKWVKKKHTKKLLVLGVLCLLAGGLFAGFKWMTDSEKVENIQASTVVPGKDGDFRLTATNKWDNTGRLNYADLEWAPIADLSQEGYRLFQSSDSGNTWTNQSLNYGKQIRVLNVYPDRQQSNTLYTWMNSLNLKDEDGNNLIDVYPVAISTFNQNPNQYLKNQLTGDYNMDVIMFGSWDDNYARDISDLGAQATQEFIASGRGVLFGHDTVYSAPNQNPKKNWWKYFHEQMDYLGVGHDPNMQYPNGNGNYPMIRTDYWSGSTKVKITNDGYLMKYPFEMENGLELTIPYSHNIELQRKNVGTVWAEFTSPFTGDYPRPPFDNATWRGGWYLKTNNNVAMIQTGHSNGRSTRDENRIIANVLYNLAQVSLQNNAQDYSVSDRQAPDAPDLDIRCGDSDNLNVRVDAKDNGDLYQWYVEASTKENGVLKSDTVEEEISSNIAGYFYRVVADPASERDFIDVVNDKKDNYGRFAESQFDSYVAPNTDSLDYLTTGSFTINEKQDSGKYLQVVAADRMSNVSKVTTVQIKDLAQHIDFETERTVDEAKLVDMTLSSETDQTMKEIEIQVPKNTEIKDLGTSAMTLPNTWSYTQNGANAGYDSITFDMQANNSKAVIQPFLEDLRFTIKSSPNTSGKIQIILKKNEESVKDNCWNAAIPQKISLTAYKEDGTALPDGDILYDQQLRIGQGITVSPISLDFYEFLEMRETNDTPRVLGLDYTVSNTYQEGKIIYSLRKATLHVRQVIVDSSDEIVVPSEGYVKIESNLYNNGNPAVDTAYQADKIVTSGKQADTPAFSDFVLSTKHLSSGDDQVLFSPVVPAFYSYLGHYVSTDAASQQTNPSITAGSAPITRSDIDASREFWITLYIKPNVDAQGDSKTPQPYSWDYQKNDLGTIKTK